MGQVQLRIALWHGTASGLAPKHLLAGDFQSRLREVKSALEQARAQWLDTGAPSELKIFVGPEGLLAKSDDECAVAYDDFKLEASGLKDLSQGLLFIPGTVIWKKPALKPSSETNRLDKLQGQLEHYQERGRSYSQLRYPSYSDSTHEKEAQSLSAKVDNKLKKLREDWNGGENVFIVRNVAYAYYNRDRLLKYYKQVEYKPGGGKTSGEISSQEKQQSHAIKFIPGHEEGVFEVPLASDERVRCGMEICADHYNGQLKNSAQGRNVHLHFILSDYVYNNNQAFSARSGGYIVHASTVKSQSGLFAHDGKELTPVQSIELAVGMLRCYSVPLDV